MRFVVLGAVFILVLVLVVGFLVMAYVEHRENKPVRAKPESPRKVRARKRQEIDRVLTKAIQADLQSNETASSFSIKEDVLNVVGQLDAELTQYTVQQYEKILEREQKKYYEQQHHVHELDKIDMHRSILRELRSGDIT